MKKLLLIAFLVCTICSCGKSDVTAPVITVSAPLENQVFTGGQTITIKAAITDNDGIHMIHCEASDNATGGHMVHFEEHFDGKTYELNQSFPTVAGKTYSIMIEAEDHANNKTKKQLTVSTN